MLPEIIALTFIVALQSIGEIRSDGHGLQRAQNAISQIEENVSRCDISAAREVVYVGQTDDQLVRCIQTYGSSGRSLTISSGGGDALKALEAAEQLRANGWPVRVRGMCASSCANYIVPAARAVSVEPYSMILLHGGPIDTPAYIEHVQTLATAQQKASNPAVSDEDVAIGREFIRRTMLLLISEHNAFTHSFGVAEEWFSLDAFNTPSGGFTPSEFAVADKEYVELNLPNTSVGAFWQAETHMDRVELRKLVRNTSLFFREGE